MPSSQHHGIEFQRLLSAALAPGQPVPDPGPAVFDVPAELDARAGLASSIKTAKIARRGGLAKTNVSMADARRTFAHDQPYRLLVAPYTQTGDRKRVDEVFEFVLSSTELETLRGTVSLEQVDAFHQAIKAIPKGEHRPGRAQARTRKKELMDGHTSAYVLNPKIGGDRDHARRLQSSVPLGTLLDVVDDVRVHRCDFLGTPLPLEIASPCRERHRKAAPSSTLDPEAAAG